MMIRSRSPRLVVLSLLLMLSVLAPSYGADTLSEARQLLASGEHRAAAGLLQTFLSSDVDSDQKAQALDLLGEVAFDGSDLALAKESWGRMLDSYPTAAKAAGVGTKLELINALIESRGDQDKQSSLLEPQKTPSQAAAKEPSPEVSKKKQVVTPVVAQKVAPPTPAKPSSGLVLVAGAGRPHDAVTEATAVVLESLSSSGVNVLDAAGGLPVVHKSETLLPSLVLKAKDAGASSFLLLTWEFATVRKALAECFTSEGTELWRIKVKGGTGVTGRTKVRSKIDYQLIDRFQEKLSKKIGGPCLPQTSK